MSDREMRQAIKEIHRVFVKKPELRDACLEQFRLSIKTKSETLNAAFINKYLQRDIISNAL